jgi:hypothetical protein
VNIGSFLGLLVVDVTILGEPIVTEDEEFKPHEIEGLEPIKTIPGSELSNHQALLDAGFTSTSTNTTHAPFTSLDSACAPEDGEGVCSCCCGGISSNLSSVYADCHAASVSRWRNKLLQKVSEIDCTHAIELFFLSCANGVQVWMIDGACPPGFPYSVPSARCTFPGNETWPPTNASQCASNTTVEDLYTLCDLQGCDSGVVQVLSIFFLPPLSFCLSLAAK